MSKIPKLISFILCMAFASTSMAQAWSVSEKVTNVKNTVVDAWKSKKGKLIRSIVGRLAISFGVCGIVTGVRRRIVSTSTNERFEILGRLVEVTGKIPTQSELEIEVCTHDIINREIGKKFLIGGFCLFGLGWLIAPKSNIVID